MYKVDSECWWFVKLSSPRWVPERRDTFPGRRGMDFPVAPAQVGAPHFIVVDTEQPGRNVINITLQATKSSPRVHSAPCLLDKQTTYTPTRSTDSGLSVFSRIFNIVLSPSWHTDGEGNDAIWANPFTNILEYLKSTSVTATLTSLFPFKYNFNTELESFIETSVTNEK